MAAHVWKSIFVDFYIDHVGAAAHWTVLYVLLLTTFAIVDRDDDILAAGAAYVRSFIIELNHRFVDIIYVVIHEKDFSTVQPPCNIGRFIGAVTNCLVDARGSLGVFIRVYNDINGLTPNF